MDKSNNLERANDCDKQAQGHASASPTASPESPKNVKPSKFGCCSVENTNGCGCCCKTCSCPALPIDITTTHSNPHGVGTRPIPAPAANPLSLEIGSTSPYSNNSSFTGLESIRNSWEVDTPFNHRMIADDFDQFNHTNNASLAIENFNAAFMQKYDQTNSMDDMDQDLENMAGSSMDMELDGSTDPAALSTYQASFSSVSASLFLAGAGTSFNTFLSLTPECRHAKTRQMCPQCKHY